MLLLSEIMLLHFMLAETQVMERWLTFANLEHKKAQSVFLEALFHTTVVT